MRIGISEHEGFVWWTEWDNKILQRVMCKIFQVFKDIWWKFMHRFKLVTVRRIEPVLRLMRDGNLIETFSLVCIINNASIVNGIACLSLWQMRAWITFTSRCSPFPFLTESLTVDAWAITCPPTGFFGSAINMEPPAWYFSENITCPCTVVNLSNNFSL